VLGQSPPHGHHSDSATEPQRLPLTAISGTAKVRGFVNWWEGAVTPKKGGDRGNQYTEPKAQIGAFGKDEAEAETGISHQQVSRWRKRLKNADRRFRFTHARAGAP